MEWYSEHFVGYCNRDSKSPRAIGPCPYPNDPREDYCIGCTCNREEVGELEEVVETE